MNNQRVEWLFNEYNRAARLAQAGQYKDAEAILRTVVSDFEQVGEPKTLMMVLVTLASVSSRLPDVDAAIADSEKVIQFSRKVGDAKHEQMFTQNLTKLYLSKGQHLLNAENLDGACSIYQTALALARATNSILDEGRCLGNIATIYRAKGDPNLALEFHEKAITSFQTGGFWDCYAIESCNMAHSYRDLREYQKARQVYENLLTNYADHMTDSTRHSCTGCLAVCAHMLEDWSTAKLYYEMALSTAQTNESPQEMQCLETGLQKVRLRQKRDVLTR